MPSGVHRLREPRIRIAPSLLAADFSRLRDELARIEAAGADLLHLDVMDGHYVPNISFGVPIVERIRGICGLYFDTHLMIMEPARYAEAFVRAGADGITFHTEVVNDPRPLIDLLRKQGAAVGVSLNPRTPASALDACLDLVDIVNVMTVEPGFGGQAFMPEMLDKISQIAPQLRADQRLEVDGGVNDDTIERAVAAGADTIVAGTAVFRAANPGEAMAEMRRRAESAWRRRNK